MSELGTKTGVDPVWWTRERSWALLSLVIGLDGGPPFRALGKEEACKWSRSDCQVRQSSTTPSVPIVISEAGLVDQIQSTGIRLALPYWITASNWFFNAVM